MSKTDGYLTLIEISLGLRMDKSNLKKIIKKLNLKPHRIRGKMNQWSNAYSPHQISQLLEYRDGLPHSFIKLTNGSYRVRSNESNK